MVTLTDLAGSNTTVPITFPSGFGAWWVQFIVTGTGTVRLGDSTVTSSKGLPIPAGGGQYVAPAGGHSNFYGSGEFSAYIPTGATLSVAIKECQS